jgi:hypothetical protein
VKIKAKLSHCPFENLTGAIGGAFAAGEPWSTRGGISPLTRDTPPWIGSAYIQLVPNPLPLVHVEHKGVLFAK